MDVDGGTEAAVHLCLETIMRQPLTGSLTPEQVEQLLHTQVVGRLACVDDEGLWIFPISYVYDGARVICHSRIGRKVQAMRAHPSVCFEVEDVQGLTNWQSVVAKGSYRELAGTEAAAAMSLFINRLSPLVAAERRHASVGSLTPHGHDATQAVVFCIEDLEKSGRFENW